MSIIIIHNLSLEIATIIPEICVYMSSQQFFIHYFTYPRHFADTQKLGNLPLFLLTLMAFHPPSETVGKSVWETNLPLSEPVLCYQNTKDPISLQLYLHIKCGSQRLKEGQLLWSILTLWTLIFICFCFFKGKSLSYTNSR